MNPGCNYLVQEDFIPFLQDVVNTHPGLAFLKEASEFHSRYITTVIQRIFYTVNRSWSGRITCAELRRSSFLQVGSWTGGRGGDSWPSLLHRVITHPLVHPCVHPPTSPSSIPASTYSPTVSIPASIYSPTVHLSPPPPSASLCLRTHHPSLHALSYSFTHNSSLHPPPHPPSRIHSLLCHLFMRLLFFSSILPPTLTSSLHPGSKPASSTHLSRRQAPDTGAPGPP
uniref:PP2A regulatory subunit B'' EF-hand domain-containing protein n=1 Tax=Sus scrofa TaxID=9823 RepID=A0A8D1UQS9_PIG